MSYNPRKTHAFRALSPGGQTVAVGAEIKVQFPTEVFDRAGDYDPALHRYVPSAPSEYWLTTVINTTCNSSVTDVHMRIQIRRNGSSLFENIVAKGATTQRGSGFFVRLDAAAEGLAVVSSVGDYFEVYLINDGPTSAITVFDTSQFCGFRLTGKA